MEEKLKWIACFVYASEEAELFKIVEIAELIKKAERFQDVILINEYMDQKNLSLNTVACDVLVSFLTEKSERMDHLRLARSVIGKQKWKGLVPVVLKNQPFPSSYFGLEPYSHKFDAENSLEDNTNGIISWIRLHTTLTDNLKDPSSIKEWAEELFDRGRALSNLGAYYDGLERFEEALSLYRKIRHLKGISDILTVIGMIVYDLFQFDRAKRCLVEASSILDEIGKAAGKIGSVL